jgi:hypothetical protein
MSGEARNPQGAGFYNTDGQRLLNEVRRDPALDAAATRYILAHGGADLLEMVGLS